MVLAGGAAPSLADLSGIELMQGIADGRFPPPPIMSLFDARILSVDPGEAIFGCVTRPFVPEPVGLVHGGFLCTMMDSAIGLAVITESGPMQAYATIELKVSFLSRCRRRQPVEVVGTMRSLGRRVAFAEAHAYDSAAQPARPRDLVAGRRCGLAGKALQLPRQGRSRCQDLGPLLITVGPVALGRRDSRGGGGEGRRWAFVKRPRAGCWLSSGVPPTVRHLGRFAWHRHTNNPPYWLRTFLLASEPLTTLAGGGA